MPNHSSKDRPDEDEVQAAFRIVQQATRDRDEKPEKNPAAVALGRLGGLKGGEARAKALTPERRSEIARKVARARWKQSSQT